MGDRDLSSERVLEFYKDCAVEVSAQKHFNKSTS